MLGDKKIMFKAMKLSLTDPKILISRFLGLTSRDGIYQCVTKSYPQATCFSFSILKCKLLDWQVTRLDKLGEFSFFFFCAPPFVQPYSLLKCSPIPSQSYYFEESGVVFCGDALFPLGCGRIFEGTPAQSYNAVKAITELPPLTQIYSAHEYALSNAKFALSVNPSNKALTQRVKYLEGLRSEGKPTVPSTVGEECETNPFVILPTERLQQAEMATADPVSIFGRLRQMKDEF